MQFTVYIRTTTDDFVVDLDEKEIGLALVNQIRTLVNSPTVSIADIEGTIPNYYAETYTIELTEDEAALTGLFNNSCSIDVITKPLTLNRYFEEALNIETKPYGMIRVFNKKRFITDWANQKYDTFFRDPSIIERREEFNPMPKKNTYDGQ
jgi:hypothetical protein